MYKQASIEAAVDTHKYSTLPAKQRYVLGLFGHGMMDFFILSLVNVIESLARWLLPCLLGYVLTVL